MKVGRLPSSGITRPHRYFAPLRLRARPRLRLRLPLYRAVAAITRDRRDLPRYPAHLPSPALPTTPESPAASSLGELTPQMAAAFPT